MAEQAAVMEWMAAAAAQALGWAGLANGEEASPAAASPPDRRWAAVPAQQGPPPASVQQGAAVAGRRIRWRSHAAAAAVRVHAADSTTMRMRHGSPVRSTPTPAGCAVPGPEVRREKAERTSIRSKSLRAESRAARSRCWWRYRSSACVLKRYRRISGSSKVDAGVHASRMPHGTYQLTGLRRLLYAAAVRMHGERVVPAHYWYAPI